MTNLKKEILQLPPESIKPNPYQPRRIFNQCALDELAASIREYGVLQPISVRLINGASYELIAGERRLRASKLAGLKTIPAILVEINDLDSAVLAMIENLQRQNLHFFEEAEGYCNLMNDYGFTQEALAARVGKTQSTVANKIRVLKLPEEVRAIISAHELTERHARALLKLKSGADQLAILRKITDKDLNVRETENLIEQTLEDVKPKRNTTFIPFVRDIRILTNSIKETLEIARHAGLASDFVMEKTTTGYMIQITLDLPASSGKTA
jgi:ParB family chromosome partitioning protein